MNKNKSILIAEDDAITAFWITTVLQRMGYHTYKPVATGELAVEAAAVHKPDFIVMDIWLAGLINGIDAAAEILSGFNTSIIFISGFTEGEITRQIEQVDYTAFLRKPLDVSELERIFNQQ